MSKLSIATAGLTMTALASTPAWADPSGFGFHGSHQMWGGGPGWFFGPILMFLTIAAFATFIVLVVRWLTTGKPDFGGQTTPDGGTNSTAIDILKQRFAKGEIDEKEFDERRKVLEA